MKYLRFIIIFVLFAGLVILLTRIGAKEYAEKNKVLKNGVTFEGVVTDIKRSNNHSFGILSVNISKSNVNDFSAKPEQGIYPYQIRGKQGEIYLPAFVQREVGDSVKLISDQEIVYYKGQKSSDKGEVYIITESEDIDFVKQNSLFK